MIRCFYHKAETVSSETFFFGLWRRNSGVTFKSTVTDMWCTVVSGYRRCGENNSFLLQAKGHWTNRFLDKFISLETWCWEDENIKLKCLRTWNWRFWENLADGFENISCLLIPWSWNVWEHWDKVFEKMELKCLRTSADTFDTMELKYLRTWN
jgi:hypothetical protein